MKHYTIEDMKRQAVIDQMGRKASRGKGSHERAVPMVDSVMHYLDRPRTVTDLQWCLKCDEGVIRRAVTVLVADGKIKREVKHGTAIYQRVAA
jgi:biotin synthase-related radical SAM superfamily protein